jgi:hypothetical protein
MGTALTSALLAKAWEIETSILLHAHAELVKDGYETAE